MLKPVQRQATTYGVPVVEVDGETEWAGIEGLAGGELVGESGLPLGLHQVVVAVGGELEGQSQSTLMLQRSITCALHCNRVHF